VIFFSYFDDDYQQLRQPMHEDIQHQLFALVKSKLEGKENLGNALGDLLHLSTDAIYRRSRNETPLTIHELETICTHYKISFDAIINKSPNHVVFGYKPVSEFDFSLEGYLSSMQRALRNLRSCTDPCIRITTKNLPVLQLLNFPQLTRFRLYYWAKTHLRIEEYEKQKYREERATDTAFKLGADILDDYVNIPTEECYDAEFMRGFIRQILYYSGARLFEDPSCALKLMDEVRQMADHIHEQTALGYKFKFKEAPRKPASSYEVYLNDTINGDATFYYHAEETEGVYLSHNLLNFLHTTDPVYVNESKNILSRQFDHSSIISRVNEKQRNHFFHKLQKDIEQAHRQILTDIESA
jgi:hypothetical protein